MPRSDTKELKKIMKAAKAQGWLIDQTKSNHWRFRAPAPSREIAIAAWSPSDHHSVMNCIARLRRAGLRLK